ncbi:hypothetical protein QBC38DRAFT_517772 [Podospora fimiseda]|uniref:DUF6604 domain-containing protein n=1 Tax=Podospora fimiseda TaxID=252190 RepID=A0AAN7BGU7_9PEZI|nr:hypothetical protein QBC38DRAFT_517772 [Podospora fimiseda]
MSSYQTYKTLTQYIVTWLATTARTENSSRFINVNNLILLAEYLSARNSVQVPRSVLRAFTYTIQLREQVGSTITSSGQPSQEDRSHQHFIQVLRDIQVELRKLPCLPKHNPVNSHTLSDPKEQFVRAFSVLQLSPESEENVDDARERQEFVDRITDDGKKIYIYKSIATLDEALFEMRLLVDDLVNIEQVNEKHWDLLKGRIEFCIVATMTKTALLLTKDLDTTARTTFEAAI